MRKPIDFLFLYLKGLAMGAADVVPGVSGGTIAFISGIYDELLGSISAIKPSLFKTLKTDGIAGVWKAINGTFLVVLFAGIATSILSLAKLIEYLLHHHPILLWSFFFGLILASIVYIGKEIKQWNLGVIVGLILGTAFVVYLSIMPPLSANDNKLFLFFAGMVAICAMILPGISGSFILLILGAYTTIIQSLNDKDFGNLIFVALGAGSGLLLFSNLLKWLLKKYNQIMMGVLTGFLIGSLWKIWPWKKDELIYKKEVGVQEMTEVSSKMNSLSAYLRNTSSEIFEQYKSYVEHNILPNTYEQINAETSSQLGMAIVFCIIGFSIIFILERLAVKKQNV